MIRRRRWDERRMNNVPSVIWQVSLQEFVAKKRRKYRRWSRLNHVFPISCGNLSSSRACEIVALRKIVLKILHEPSGLNGVTLESWRVFGSFYDIKSSFNYAFGRKHFKLSRSSSDNTAENGRIVVLLKMLQQVRTWCLIKSPNWCSSTNNCLIPNQSSAPQY